MNNLNSRLKTMEHKLVPSEELLLRFVIGPTLGNEAENAHIGPGERVLVIGEQQQHIKAK